MSTVGVPFYFPVRQLENPRLTLEPFNVAVHAHPFVEGCRNHPHLFEYLPYGPFETTDSFTAWYHSRIASSPAEVLFAVLVKPDAASEQATLAGVIGLLHAQPTNSSLELGFITILPAFQRTFITSNAVGLLLLYALDPFPIGLGLRRCEWQSHAQNEASRRVALRMSFTFEGIQRFQRLVPAGKPDNGYDTTALRSAPGTGIGSSRDSAIFAHYCDEWSDKRAQVVAAMDRP